MNGLAPAKTLTMALALAALLLAPPAHAQTRLRVGICARTVSMGVGSPFAIAMKMGWFKQEGLDVEIVPLPGSTDCVKSVATGQLLITLPSVEPLAIVRPQGIKAKIFYTAYQANGYGLAVPADSPIQKATDLKGKNIGVTSLASAGVVVARAQVAAVAAAHIEKEWMPELSASMFRLSETGWAWSEDLRRKVKKNALAGLEDAVVWVKEQSYLELMHKTSTIRVIG